MDIALLNPNTLRIKSKNASIVVNPTSSTNKTEADAILLLTIYAKEGLAKIEGSRITIKGPGEYEMGGIKVSTTRVGQELVARVDVDGVKLLIGSGSTIEEIHDKIEECEVAVINSEGSFNYSILTTLEPSVLIVYGDKKEDVAKSLGKDSAIRTSKYSTTSDKLPQEMEVVLLG